MIGNREMFSEYASLSLVQSGGNLDGGLGRAVASSIEHLRAELGDVAAQYVDFANNGTPIGSLFPHTRLIALYEDLRDKSLADALALLADEIEQGNESTRSALLGATQPSDAHESRTDLLRQAASRLRHGAVVSRKNPGQEFLSDAGTELDELRAEFPELFAESEERAPDAMVSMVVNIAPTPDFFGDGALTELLDEMQDLEDRLERLDFIRFDAARERWVLLDDAA